MMLYRIVYLKNYVLLLATVTPINFNNNYFKRLLESTRVTHPGAHLTNPQKLLNISKRYSDIDTLYLR